MSTACLPPGSSGAGLVENTALAFGSAASPGGAGLVDDRLGGPSGLGHRCARGRGRGGRWLADRRGEPVLDQVLIDQEATGAEQQEDHDREPQAAAAPR